MLALAGTDEGIFLENIFIGFQYWEIFFYFPTRFQVLNIKYVLRRKESCCRWGYNNILSQDKLDMIFRAKNSMSGKCRRPPRTCLNTSGPGPQQPILESESWSAAHLGTSPSPFPHSSPSCVPLPWYPALAMYDPWSLERCEKRWESEMFAFYPLLVTCVLAW